jgi:tripartite-type tricarboxylate transporter receptor subunit TctC
MFMKQICFIKRNAVKLFGLMLIAGVSTMAQAQSWPTKPIKLIIPFAAGGTTDILGRILAQQMSYCTGTKCDR